MQNNDNINWRELVTSYASYEGRLSDFCNLNNVSKNQLYYYRKKFKNETDVQFHAISMKEEKSKREITIAPAKKLDVRFEIGAAKIYIPANEIAIIDRIVKELLTNV